MSAVRLWLAACVAAGTLCAAPAVAGEARCLWDAVPIATQDRLLAAYARGGADGPSDVKLEAAESRRQMLNCAQLGGVVDPKRSVAAMRLALHGLAVRQGAAAALAALGAHQEQQLEAAWRELSPSQRILLHARSEKLSESLARAPDWESAAAVLLDFMSRLDRLSGGLPRTDAAVDRELQAYVLGRSLQEAFEPRF